LLQDQTAVLVVLAFPQASQVRLLLALAVEEAVQILLAVLAVLVAVVLAADQM
jgi:hypothetical protein